MTYDPRTYWPERYGRQGAAYVAKGGRREAYRDQQVAVGALLAAHVEPCGTLLDFGCGAGRFTPVLAGLCERYIGADIVTAAVLACPGGANVRYQALGSHRLTLDDASVNTVACLTVLQHIVDDDDFARWTAELGRVLRPGGTLVVWDHWPAADMQAHMRPRGPKAIADAVGTGPFAAGSGAREGTVEDAGDGHWFGVARKAGG